ncbi:cytochrome b6-f complex subunit PetL [Crocosphaera sp. UHCC 0190]|nr:MULTISPECIES: cytochrome b6-f complex subunit PetL [unclassified Crocosphaera]MEA5509249.1 cytochrome b6-f complex subunit PetL [Crocosphaera sp. UHCC 0190]MEA5535610.1 cytochrome b6-f complex subunit PetL [Crocosphaera sp. XPORK-15E]
MSGFVVAAFAGYLIAFTGIALGLYFGLRTAKII